MAYANRTEAQEAMRRAQAATTFSSWAERKAFNDKWNAIVQGATKPEPSSVYNTKFTDAERQAYDTRKQTAAAEAYANPNFPDPTPPAPAPQAAAAGSQGMTANEYEYQKAIDLANIAAQSGERIATIGKESALGVAGIQKESALGVAGIQKESALGVANIDKQIKEMQLESAENLQKLSNRNKLTLANLATNQSIFTGLVNAFNF